MLPAAVAVVLLGSGCGYIGGPMVPLANIPATVTDLAAVQRGGAILAHFTPPAFTTEHVVISGPLAPELRIGVWPEGASVETWAASAKPAASPIVENGLETYRVPAAEWVGKEVVLASRVTAENGKKSAWSNYVILPVVPPPDPPAGLAATSTAAGVRLAWRSAAPRFRVVRKAGEETQYTTVAPDLTEHEWTDPNSTPGTAYSYMVQSVVPLGNGRQAESELAEVKITPEAPLPAAPAGLVAVPGSNSIELTWEVPSGDVAGYRLYRALASGAFEKLAEMNGIPTYSDRAVEHGKSYRYAVSAVNSSGREGPRSEIREAFLQ